LGLFTKSVSLPKNLVINETGVMKAKKMIPSITGLTIVPSSKPSLYQTKFKGDNKRE
jgi:hypothetical protein